MAEGETHGVVGQHCDKSSKYRSRLMLAVRINEVIISSPTDLYVGMMSGLIMPALEYARWSPFCRANSKPSFKKMHSSTSQQTLVKRGIL